MLGLFLKEKSRFITGQTTFQPNWSLFQTCRKNAQNLIEIICIFWATQK